MKISVIYAKIRVSVTRIKQKYLREIITCKDTIKAKK